MNPAELAVKHVLHRYLATWVLAKDEGSSAMINVRSLEGGSTLCTPLSFFTQSVLVVQRMSKLLAEFHVAPACGAARSTLLGFHLCV